MRSDVVQIYIGIFVLVGSTFALKITNQDILWAGIALGAFVGIRGGIQVSMRDKASL